jgi:hypothetical protein
MVLKYGAAIPLIRWEIIDQLTSDMDITRILIFQTGDKPKQGRFSTAAGTQ